MGFNLLAESIKDGFCVHHDSNSKGGQYNGPSVKCGGTDRLRIQPSQGEYGWFICAQCGFKGSGIDWLMEVRGWQKREALKYVGWEPKDTSGARMIVPRHVLVGKEDPTHQAPPGKWQTQAKAFVQHCRGILWGDLGQPALDYLRSRGLKDETIQAAQLGYNHIKMKQTGAKWGRRKNGELWQGIVIPWFVRDEIWRITIRDETLPEGTKEGRYKQVAGGSNGLYLASSLEEDKPVVLAEGEISALSMLQECDQHVAVCATGSKDGSRIAQWIVALAQKDLVLLAFDADDPGDKAAQWWLQRLENAHRLRPWWADANQMLQDEIDLLNEWVIPNLDRIANLLTKTSGGDLPIPDEKCHSCQRPFPNFEGWDPELIPPDIMSYDPTDGNSYCKQCRPDLFGDVPFIYETEASMPEPVLSYLTTVEQVRELAEQLEASTTYVLDLETTGLNPRKDKIITLALGTPGNVSTIDLRGFYAAPLEVQAQWQEALQKLLHRDDITWAGHNLKFDWSFLAVQFGVRLRKVYDTMLVEKLIHNGERVSASLLNTAARYDIEVTKEARNWFIGLDQRPDEWHAPLPTDQLTYIRQDIEVPHQLIGNQQEAIERLGLRQVLDLENNALPTIAAMEVRGITVDIARWESILKMKQTRQAELTAHLKQTLGTALAGLQEIQQGMLFGEHALPDVNLASSDQLVKALGALGVVVFGASKDVLEEMRDTHEIIPLLLEWKELEKFITAFGKSLLRHVEEDGRIHASFDQLGAVSGRITCRDPNLQQIPKPQKGAEAEDLRSCFIAPQGHKLLVADLSNIELRILADVSRDPVMLRFFAEGKDLHSETARLMFKLGADVDPKKHLINGVKARDIAKTINFGLAYGMGATGLAGRVGVDLETAKQLMNKYFATYKGVAGYLKQSGRKGTEQGYTVSLSGRRRSFSRAQLADNKQRGEAERAAKNHPIQGTNADILKRALALLSEQLPENVHVVLTVHDEIVLEAPTEKVEIAENILQRTMVDACRDFLKTVAIPEPDVLIADYWVKG
jgi:DNA polymerase-1